MLHIGMIFPPVHKPVTGQHPGQQFAYITSFLSQAGHFDLAIPQSHPAELCHPALKIQSHQLRTGLLIASAVKELEKHDTHPLTKQ